MTKTEILTDITTKFADESNITAEEQREFLEGLVNYLVPDVIDISHETPSTIIQFWPGMEGYVSISKVGRLVTMYGKLINVSGSLGPVGFVILDEDYKPASALPPPDSTTKFAYGNGVYNESGVSKPTIMSYVFNTIQSDVPIPSGRVNSVKFSITYLTNS